MEMCLNIRKDSNAQNKIIFIGRSNLLTNKCIKVNSSVRANMAFNPMVNQLKNLGVFKKEEILYINSIFHKASMQNNLLG